MLSLNGPSHKTLCMSKEVWNEIRTDLEHTIDPGLFTAGIRPLDAEVEEGRLRLLAPNSFVAGWVREKLHHSVLEIAQKHMGGSVELVIDVRKPTAKADKGSSVVAAAKTVTPEVQKQSVAAQAPAAPVRSRGSYGSAYSGSTQMGLPISDAPRPIKSFNWRFSFNDFVVGPSNELACAASRSLCSGNMLASSLFLSSKPGLGKTHLLHSVGSQLNAVSNKDRLNIACLTSEEFTNRLVWALKSGEMARFKSRFRESIDVLLLEDVHFFQGKQKIQDELLGTVKALQERGCRVVMTSSFLPKELQDVDEQLASRFCSGLVAGIHLPDFETRRRILEEKARRFNIAVPDDISNLLAERITTDIRQLESCLNNLVLKAQLLNRQMTMEMAWEVLENFDISRPAPSMDKIVEFVCKSYGLTSIQLKSKSRKKQIVLARNTAFYLARKHTELSLKSIGEHLSRRHSTVLKGITNIEREISIQTPLGRQIEQTVERLSQ
ncbi:MAG: chromosomal replication initiator protein DnaA [Desulfovibrio sp.]